jgi:hypothetical protein
MTAFLIRHVFSIRDRLSMLFFCRSNPVAWRKRAYNVYTCTLVAHTSHLFSKAGSKIKMDDAKYDTGPDYLIVLVHCTYENNQPIFQVGLQYFQCEFLHILVLVSFSNEICDRSSIQISCSTHNSFFILYIS